MIPVLAAPVGLSLAWVLLAIVNVQPSAAFTLNFIVLLMTSNLVGPMNFAMLYCLTSGITSVTRAALPLQIFPSATRGRARGGWPCRSTPPLPPHHLSSLPS
ncbi:hypothetical protein [Rhizobium leguminosarum]|uniref:hypothetical protein n=1 Tax=Rhizobium leguminosarum TaxID=384 RepID=UPI0021BBD5AC|nr:hypothetical protein [Rhizobium leguminosarum]